MKSTSYVPLLFSELSSPLKDQVNSASRLVCHIVFPSVRILTAQLPTENQDLCIETGHFYQVES